MTFYSILALCESIATSQKIAYLTTHKPIKFRIIKIKVKLKLVASASIVRMKRFQF